MLNVFDNNTKKRGFRPRFFVNSILRRCSLSVQSLVDCFAGSLLVNELYSMDKHKFQSAMAEHFAAYGYADSHAAEPGPVHWLELPA